MIFDFFRRKPIFFYNTLVKSKERFRHPKRKAVRLYHCGPTVYDNAHIGNLRSYVFSDTLRRALEINGYRTEQVINITDVGHLSSDADEGEDKMTKSLARSGKTLTLDNMYALGTFYMNAFIKDLEALNILMPHFMPRASEHIAEDIELISRLEKKGFIYKTEHGVYFDTSKDKDYGKLGGIDVDVKVMHSRLQSTEKKASRDFAVWKFSKDAIGWESPWGKGYPGWHIECSVMAMHYLGKTIDIHTGGQDHIPIHHNNEIAQSESATGRTFAKIWMHNAFLTISDGKMSKSAGNFLTLDELEENGVSPLGYRMWLLQASYRSPMNLSWEALSSAEDSYTKLINFVSALPSPHGTPDKKIVGDFIRDVNDDLNTAKAISKLWATIHDTSLAPDLKHATILEMDKVLGLKLREAREILRARASRVPADVIALAEEREEARKNKNWQHSDVLRIAIEQKGYTVEDRADGYKLQKNPQCRLF